MIAKYKDEILPEEILELMNQNQSQELYPMHYAKLFEMILSHLTEFNSRIKNLEQSNGGKN